MAKQVRNLTSIHKNVGLIAGLAQWGKGSGAAMKVRMWLISGIAVAVL